MQEAPALARAPPTGPGPALALALALTIDGDARWTPLRWSSPPPTRLRTPFPVVAWRAVINLDATSSLLEHAVVPALAVIDWVAFGSGRVRQLWWTSLSWLILPIGYLAVYYNLRDSSGEPLYPFLDPGAANFWTWVGIMIGVFIAVGAVVWSVGLLRSAGRRSGAAAAAPMPDR